MLIYKFICQFFVAFIGAILVSFIVLNLLNLVLKPLFHTCFYGIAINSIAFAALWIVDLFK